MLKAFIIAAVVGWIIAGFVGSIVAMGILWLTIFIGTILNR